MNIISEAFNHLDKLLENSNEYDQKIFITAEITLYDIDGAVVSGISNYDDNTLDEWYNFESDVEYLIGSIGEINSINSSDQLNSLSEYIDFQCYDTSGNLKNCLINLRLSDHQPTHASKRTRNNRLSKLTMNYKKLNVTVNSKVFDSYDEALKYVQILLGKEVF